MNDLIAESKNNALLDVENLASRFHQVYDHELKRQGKKSKHSKFFSQLPQEIADLDRALAKYVIEFVIPRTQMSEQAIAEKTREDTIIEVRKTIARSLGYSENSDLDPSPQRLITESELFEIFYKLSDKRAGLEKGGA